MKKPARDQMALSPLDLQTLFTQADKVGKQESAMREGAVLFQSIHQAKNQQEAAEKLKTVNETQNTGDGAESIKDNNEGQAGHEGGRRHSAKETEESAKEEIIRDPDLGMNIDVSL
jgi:ribosome assembly protein YihI (activator of Der GTPase)